MLKLLWDKLKESLISVIPVTVLVLIISFTPLVDFTAKEIIVFIISAFALIIGISLFNLGADISLTPMGEHIGSGLTKSKKIFLIVGVCFIMGVLTTVAEPDLSVLAEQISSVINNTLLVVCVGIGVGLFLITAVLKIIFKKDLNSILMFFYMLLFALSIMVVQTGKSSFIPLSFDSGGVTTGPITVPFIMALGLGIAMTIGGKNSKQNSFGLIALCSIGPVITVTILSFVSKGNIEYGIPDYSIDSYLGLNLFKLILENMKDVLISLSLLLVFFFILQFTILKLPKNKIYQILIGIGYTFVGLVIFLTAVCTGFMPIGYKLGNSLASSNKVILAVFAFILGAVVVLAEPAVHVLNKQVEEITTGLVTKKQMTIALSLGIGISICLSVIRIIFNFSIMYYIIPGYLISLGLSLFVPKLYTAIAFDSGGVASGPLTSSFILPMAIGACTAIHGTGSIMDLAFGIVAMVAMTPLITIQILGFRGVVSEKNESKRAIQHIISSDDNQIIYF